MAPPIYHSSEIASYNSTIMAKTNNSIKVIFFDAGSTLIYWKDPWPPIYAKADQALMKSLEEAGIQLGNTPLCREGETFLDAYYAWRGKGTIEKTTLSALNERLQQKGFPDVPTPVLRSALDAMYSVTQQNWYLEEDAIPTLTALQEAGYRLGMISNTSDDNNVQQLVDRWGLRPFFESIITSAGCGIRKPDKQIFQLALEHFQVPPEQAVMVGDLLEADVLGANQAGIYSVWITRRAENTADGELAVQPQAVISRLDQLPQLLADLACGDE
jgi:HAD superfamily hydrolase (TIGR01662 family)